ncbi:nucleotide exchange factor GrpE [Hugonella massiliensis]|uniref:nucleotide exchange factor GrpE n=1 Tax=Hugonella massiliensis TaxID=1720315 RepID=UPI0009E877E6|nr:nucleotide exchange factor GrpE [Hugonella massiliensis]
MEEHQDHTEQATDAAEDSTVEAAAGAQEAPAADQPAQAAADAATADDAAAPSADDALAAAKAEAAEWQDRFMRLHAEWDTYRRRTNDQREEERKRANEKLVGNLLPVLDDFERSIEYAVKNGEGDLLDGVQKVHTKLVDVLVKSGVEVIDPAGQPFDALEAQAVAKVDNTQVPDETVQDVYQKGYKMGKKVIRPAMVTVTSGGPKREKKEEADKAE